MNKKEQWEKHLENAVHYYCNARDELRAIPIDDGFYEDRKRLRRAAGVCWLAVTEAATGFLMKNGVDKKKLCSADAFRQLLSDQRQIDGKFIKHYESALRLVHVEVYYEGEDSVATVKDAFDHARFIVEKLTGARL